VGERPEVGHELLGDGSVEPAGVIKREARRIRRPLAEEDPARIGELAYLNNIMLLELATQNASLESAFMELTADSVEYLAGEDR